MVSVPHLVSSDIKASGGMQRVGLKTANTHTQKKLLHQLGDNCLCSL